MHHVKGHAQTQTLQIEWLVLLPVLQDFNILRYNPGQHYNGHMDTFDPHTLAHNSPAFGQRMATFLMYLSDVEEGGETVFRFEGRYGELNQAALCFTTPGIFPSPSPPPTHTNTNTRPCTQQPQVWSAHGYAF
jgi:hypothetical protein